MRDLAGKWGQIVAYLRGSGKQGKSISPHLCRLLQVLVAKAEQALLVFVGGRGRGIHQIGPHGGTAHHGRPRTDGFEPVLDVRESLLTSVPASRISPPRARRRCRRWNSRPPGTRSCRAGCPSPCRAAPPPAGSGAWRTRSSAASTSGNDAPGRPWAPARRPARTPTAARGTCPPYRSAGTSPISRPGIAGWRRIRKSPGQCR